jgi:hypothetical protein
MSQPCLKPATETYRTPRGDVEYACADHVELFRWTSDQFTASGGVKLKYRLFGRWLRGREPRREGNRWVKP